MDFWDMVVADVHGIRPAELLEAQKNGQKVFGTFCVYVPDEVVIAANGSDALLMDYDIQTRSGGHCAPLMHEHLGTAAQGAVRFSWGWFNTEEEVDAVIRAVAELAAE